MRTKGNSVFQIGVVKKLADNEFHRGVQLGPQVPPTSPVVGLHRDQQHYVGCAVKTPHGQFYADVFYSSSLDALPAEHIRGTVVPYSSYCWNVRVSVIRFASHMSFFL